MGGGRGQGHGDPNVPTLSLVERLSNGIICKSRGVCDELGRGGGGVEVTLVTRYSIFMRVLVSVLVRFCFLVFVLQSDRIYNINSCPSVLNLPHRPRLLPMGAGDGGSEWQGERGSGDEVVTQK